MDTVTAGTLAWNHWKYAIALKNWKDYENNAKWNRGSFQSRQGEVRQMSWITTQVITAEELFTNEQTYVRNALRGSRTHSIMTSAGLKRTSIPFWVVWIGFALCLLFSFLMGASHHLSRQWVRIQSKHRLGRLWTWDRGPFNSDRRWREFRRVIMETEVLWLDQKTTKGRIQSRAMPVTISRIIACIPETASPFVLFSDQKSTSAPSYLLSPLSFNKRPGGNCFTLVAEPDSRRASPCRSSAATMSVAVFLLAGSHAMVCPKGYSGIKRAIQNSSHETIERN
jgi:hypothetical protein